MPYEQNIIRDHDSNDLSVADSYEDLDHDQLFFVTSYSNFDKLAHGPRGVEANQSIHVYRFHAADGSMVLQNKFGSSKELINPAFSRYHPRFNVIYTCTEDCQDNGQIIAYNVSGDGNLTKMGQIDAGGTSTCYLTIDRSQRNMLVVNYWDSTLAVIALDPKTGGFLSTKVHSVYDPKGGNNMKAALKLNGGVNHSCNDVSTIKQRQADPHSHALVLDKYVGIIAYVPDLGKDLIREFYYNHQSASIELQINEMPSGLCTGHPDGPRYFEFHPRFNIAYVVNELSSTVAVFSVDRKLLDEMSTAAKRKEDMSQFLGRSTLTLIQSIKTIPSAFDTTLNTCGRICVHQSGRFVIVSNRGHESIVAFRVISKGPKRGQLKAVEHYHTRGETPRHFQFDTSGQYLIVANQDSNSIAVFTFNLSSGEIKYTGNEYNVPSPNFVCCCPLHDSDIPIPSSIVSESSFEIDSDLETSDRSTITVEKNKGGIEEKLKAALIEVEDLKRRLALVNTHT